MKRTIVKLLLICAAMLMTVGGTIAYLTDSDGDVNVMTLGRVDIELIEKERVPGSDPLEYRDFQKDHPLIPGVYPENTLTGKDATFWPESVYNAVDKIVSVENTGDSDAYVRLWFAFEVTGEKNFFEDKIRLNKDSDTWEWVFLPETLERDEECYVVAVATYPQLLPKDATTPVSLRQVLLDSSATNEDVAALGEKYNILVVAQGVQASGFSSAEQALNGGFGNVSLKNHPFANMSENEPTFDVEEGSLRSALTQVPGIPGENDDHRDIISGVTFGRLSEYSSVVKEADAFVPVEEEQAATGTMPMLFSTAYAEESASAGAYYVKDGETYHIYILSEGTIKLPKDCEELMGGFGNLKVFTATNLDASDVEHMKNLFKGCTNLTVVTVPDGVTIIPEDMFADCENLEVIEIPGTVEQINPNAFNSKKDTVYLIVEKGSAAEEWGDSTDGFHTTNVPFVWWNMGDYIHIEKYIGTASEVVVPETIEGLPVEVLGSNAFAAMEHMDIVTSVTLPETIRRADYGVFIDCNRLRSINIPASLTRIPQDFLCMCKSLESITIPRGVVKIESGAFNACTNLRSVTISDTVTYIGYDAFKGCYSLESINLPNGLTHIGTEAFSDTRITSLTLPNTVTWLGNSAFAGMSRLRELTIPASVQYLGANCLPSGVTLRVQAGSAAEAYCQDNALSYTLMSGTVVEPSSPAKPPETPDANPSDAGSYKAKELGDVIYIDGYNDSEAPLTQLNVPKWLNGMPVRVIGTDAFAFSRHLQTVTLPEGLWEIKPTAFSSCQKLTSVYIPNSVNNIGRDAFSDCGKLVNINIPTSITSINDNTFRGCYSLTMMTIPGNVLRIEREAFAYCSGLETVTIKEGVQSLAAKAFANCSNLKSINIPKSVTSIGKGVFDGCHLVQVTVYQNTAGHEYCVSNGIPYNLLDADGKLIQNAIPTPTPQLTPKPDEPSGPIDSTEWHEWTDEIPFNWYKRDGYAGVTAYEGVGPNVVVPAELGGVPVRVLGQNTFAGMAYVKTVTLPDTLTTIEGWIFPDAQNLTKCDIPAGVTSIGSGAFFGCNSLQSVTIPPKVTEILESTFGWCESLTTVTIPGNVKLIDQMAFHDCHGMTSITIEEGVQFIGDQAFYGCNNLTSITIPRSVTKMGANVFMDCGPQLVATVYENSTAHTYCMEKGIRCKVLNEKGEVIEEPEAGGDTGGSGDVSEYKFTATSVFPFSGSRWGDASVQLVSFDAACNGNKNSVEIPATFEGAPVTTLMDNIFKGDTTLKTVIIPDSVVYIGASAFESCEKLESITVPGSEIYIAQKAFANCESLKSVTLCASKITIEDGAFVGCTNLTSLTLYAHSMVMTPAYFDSSVFEENSQLTIYAPAGSDAANWCGKNRVNFVAIGTN